MIYKVIAVIIFSGIAGIKRPIYGGLVGSITAPLMSALFDPFDLPTVLVLAAFGFGFGLMCGIIFWNILHGEEYNQQNKKTYVMPMNQPGSGQRGGIIYTDEEERNAKDNMK